MIKIENLTIKFNTQVILQNSAFYIPKGKLTLITSKSGTGKSSLFDVLSLSAPNKEMNYYINGLNLNNLSDSEINSFKTKKISYVTQNTILLNKLTVLDHLEFSLSIVDDAQNRKDKIKDVANKLNISKLLNRSVGKLSGGEKQRLMIACALLKNTDFYIFDEPTAMLDEKNKIIVISLINELVENGKYVLIATHEKEYFNNYIEYTIENQKIKTLTQCNLSSSEPSNINDICAPNKTKVINSLSVKYFFSQPFIKALYILLISVCIAFSSVISAFSFSNLKTQSSNIDDVYQAELLIFNNSIDPNYFVDQEAFLPISNDVVDSMRKIDGVTSFEPFIYLSTISSFLTENNTIEFIAPNQLDTLVVYKNGEKINTIEYTEDLGPEYTDLTIYPIYNYQNYDNRCKTVIQNEGVYITPYFANSLGIKDIDGITLSFQVAIPIAAIPALMNDTTLVRSRLCVAHILEVPIRGILDSEVYSRYDYDHTPLLFWNIEYIQSLQKQYSDKYSEAINALLTTPQDYQAIMDYYPYKVIYPTWEASAYVLKVESTSQIDTVIKEVSKINPDLGIKITELAQDEVNPIIKRELQKSAIIYPSIILFVLLIGILIIKFFTYKTQNKEFTFLRINGFDYYDLKKIMQKETLLEIGISIPIILSISYLFSNYLSQNSPMIIDFSMAFIAIQIILSILIQYIAGAIASKKIIK